jgi:hypothetical protein
MFKIRRRWATPREQESARRQSGMKYLIPVLVGGAAAIVVVTTALAQAHGAFTGRLPLTPYLYGYAAALVLLLIAAAMAIKAAKQDKLSQPPPPTALNQNVKQEANPYIEVHVGDELLRPRPAAPPKPKPSRCNIQFTGVARTEMRESNVLSLYAGQSVPFVTAAFENRAIEGQELRIPIAKARLIFRDRDGRPTADISNIAWIPGDIRYVTFEANTPRQVLLFFRVGGKLLCRSIEQTYVSIGRRRKPPRIRECEITEPVSSIEVQLLTENEQIYRTILNFSEAGKDALPQFVGRAET